LAFLVKNPIFDIYLELSKMKRFSKYMKDVSKFISPYHFEDNPLETFSKKLYDVGFKIFHIEIRDQIFIFADVELLKCKFDSFFSSITPLFTLSIHRLPQIQSKLSTLLRVGCPKISRMISSTST
jgi:hypothetical protein